MECDAVVHLEDGRWGGIEIKLGGDDLINDGAESLKRLRDKIVQKSDEKAPSFLLVLTAVGGAYKREDGVCVVPIDMLKPLQCVRRILILLKRRHAHGNLLHRGTAPLS